MTTMMTHPGLNTAVAFHSGTAGSSFDLRAFLDDVARTLSVTDAVIVTSLPRGGLQIVQSLRPADYLFKAYEREFHVQDRATWQAIVTSDVLTGEDAWGHQAFGTSSYRQDLMRTLGLAYVAAAPLTAPVLAGYAGALHVYRSMDQGPFTDQEKATLARLANELDADLEVRQRGRLSEACLNEPGWVRRPQVHQVIFDQAGTPVVGAEALSTLDSRLRQQIQQHARQRLEHINGQDVASDRLQLPDASGDLWTFRVVLYKRYPALGDGSFIFFCLQPSCCEWSVLRASDFDADAEISRVIPSLKFMRENFATGPGLGAIAQTAHLSPFHFHRRFSELMGLTPKHFMLECQIYSAKRQLAQRDVELSEIAKNCGFAHQSHFTSRFKQATGLTPTRWRRLVASANPERDQQDQ